MPSNYLSSSDLSRALRRLAALVAEAKLVLELALCHGRVLALVYHAPTSEVAFRQNLAPTARAFELAQVVAKEQRLPAAWLHEEMRYFLAFFAARNRTDFDLYAPGILISLHEPRHLLAMKLQLCADAPQTADVEDIRFLMGKMGLASTAAVEAVYHQFFPNTNLASCVTDLIPELQPLQR